MGGPDKAAASELRQWCDRARELLDAARQKAEKSAERAEQAQPAEPVGKAAQAANADQAESAEQLEQAAKAEQALQAQLRLQSDLARFDVAEGLVKATRELVAKGAGDDAGPDQKARFEADAEAFTRLVPAAGKPSTASREEKAAKLQDAGLKRLLAAANTLQETARLIIKELARRAALEGELGAIPSAVPQATAVEQADIDARVQRAAKAIAEADTAAKLDAAATSLEPLRVRIAAVAEDVAVRAAKAEALRAAAALLQAPPELPAALDAARGAFDKCLATRPLADDDLQKAEAALKLLEQAAGAAQAEAQALRALRALYGAQLDAQQARLAGLGDLQAKGTPKALATAAGDAARSIAAARALLAPDRTRQQTEGFPAALGEVEFLVAQLLRRALSENHPARQLAIGQLQRQLDELTAEARRLPSATDERKDLTVDLANLLKNLGAQVSPGASATQRQQGLGALETLAQRIATRRAEVGVEQQVYQQRWATAAAALKGRGDIPGCLAAFAVELAALAQQLGAQPPLRLDTPRVQAIETAAQRFTQRWPLAQADAQAAADVEAVWKDIGAVDLPGLLAAARPAARRHVERAHAIALKGRQDISAGRDMAATLARSRALLQLLQAVMSEPPYDAGAAELSGIDPGQRQAAHALCGPALLAKLGEGRRTQLSALLASDGAAVTTLVLDGLGGQPALLQSVLETAGAAGLQALAQAFAGDGQAGNRAALLALVDEAGLGERPAIVARLLGPPDAADDVRNARAAGVRSLAQHFGDPEGPRALATLLGPCGLGDEPALLPALLHEHGLAGDGKKLRAFADAFTGDAAAGARADLKRLVSAGGVAQHPKAFAPLVAGGGAARVKALGAAFTEPADCLRLKALLDGGGLSGDAGKPGHENEHPQTLNQLLADGFKGNADELREYARAFGDAGGPARSRELLGAFNAYGDDQGARRQPGQAVAALLEGKHFAGSRAQRIGLLATRFVPKMQTIANPVQRGQAYRMAPSLATATAGAISATPTMQANGAPGGVTESVSKRHRPETFSLAYLKKKNEKARAKGLPETQESTLFPPGTDIAALAEAALKERKAGRVFGATPTAPKQNRVTVNCPGTGEAITVEIDVCADDKGRDQIHHFGPRNSPRPGGAPLANAPPHPDETPTFLNAEIEAMYKALGLSV
jgi:hypothetical protein